MFGRTKRIVGMRLLVFVGTMLLVGACVQIGGIEDPHPKEEPVDPEWANWPMPNPQGTPLMLPNLATYEVDKTSLLVTDKITNLMWQRNVEASKYQWEDAKTHCADLDIGGHNDWRLPTAIELISLVDFTKASPGPTIDQINFPDTPGDWFWTTTREASKPNFAWVVSFNSGQTNSDDGVAPYFVRCVRP